MRAITESERARLQRAVAVLRARRQRELDLKVCGWCIWVMLIALDVLILWVGLRGGAL